MRHRVRHITEYRYDDLVPLCHNVVHLQPRDTDRQTCRECTLDIRPDPAARRDRVDFFGNHVTWLCLQEPLDRLRLDAGCEVEVLPFQRPDAAGWPTWEGVA